MSTLSKLQKAALVLEHLPKSASQKIRARLDSSDLCSVFGAINELDITDVQPFFDALAELARETQAEFSGTRGSASPATPETMIASSPGELSEASDNPFGFLFSRSAREVGLLIGEEHPREIAVVLSYLPRAIAAQMIRKLDPVQRISVVRRMCDLTGTATEDLANLVVALKHRLQKRDQAARVDQKRKDHIAGIMQLLDPEISQQLFEHLRGEVPVIDEIAGSKATDLPAAGKRKPVSRF